ncbi:MAG: polyprenol monophosphomannose synthase [Nanoarchaeota archaeon]|nr:polyprenol monophosphomannose synthase [Nanoarchaeota archaeon]
MIYVMIPTYNEASNIERLIKAILDLKIPNLRIVVVDDISPDGTWMLVQRMRKRNVELLLRRKNRGRGLAGREGFMYCLDHGADRIVEMDGDFSHDPKYIPSLIKAADTADVVLGSRNIKGGRDIERGALRKFVSGFARLYIRIVLGIKATDPTSGYRCFTRKAMETINPRTLKAKDPFIVTEVLYRAHKKRLKIAEVPIIFKQRASGKSKLGVKILFSNFIRILKLRF